MSLAGLIVISDSRRRLWAAARREARRVGALRLLDVAAYRLFARLKLRKTEDAWKSAELERLKTRFPATLDAVDRLLVDTPNSDAAREFLARTKPDILIARCKFILKPDIFEQPRVGTFALHPGICPEYRNAHGCFWALANGDLDRVGMTLLKIDKGIDTGPIYFQNGCGVDELSDSHIVIQYRAVTENLDRIADTLLRLSRREPVQPIAATGRKSAIWGQPTLTAYLRWKRAARKRARASHASGIAAVS